MSNEICVFILSLLTVPHSNRIDCLWFKNGNVTININNTYIISIYLYLLDFYHILQGSQTRALPLSTMISLRHIIFYRVLKPQIQDYHRTTLFGEIV